MPADFWTAGRPAARTIEIEKLIAGTGKARYRALGGCMAPAVQHGDLLDVVPKKAGQIEIGEIAICRRDGSLIGHRTVARGEDERGPYIVTRSDRSAGETDAPSHDDDILGVVVRVERNGRAVAAAGAQAGGPARGLGGIPLKLRAAGPAGTDWRWRMQARMMQGLSWLQDSRAYRRIAAGWRRTQRDGIQYTVWVPFAANPALPFVQKLAGEEVERLDLRAGGLVERWAIAATVSGREAASLTFLCRPPGCLYAGWWLAGIKTRIRFRGAGLEEELLRRAERILVCSGVSRLRAGPPAETGAWRWCREMGFEAREDAVLLADGPIATPALLEKVLP